VVANPNELNLFQAFACDIFLTGSPEKAKGCSTYENMGLTTRKNAPKGNIPKTDIGIEKYYLNEKELDGANGIVKRYLDYAEIQTLKGVVFYMKDGIVMYELFCSSMKMLNLNIWAKCRKKWDWHWRKVKLKNTG
jgi:hypothetical protein